jgi:hypothetical protein
MPDVSEGRELARSGVTGVQRLMYKNGQSDELVVIAVCPASQEIQ